MRFVIIHELESEHYRQVALWLRFTEDRTKSKFMVKGGAIIEADKYIDYSLEYHHPKYIASVEHELAGYQTQINYMLMIERGVMGYVRQQEGSEERWDKIIKLQPLMNELKQELYYMKDMQWLMEPGAIFDDASKKREKEAWLLAVRNQPKALPGEQADLFERG